MLRIAGEFIRGLRALHFGGPYVSVFGSARFGVEHPYYSVARAVERGLSELGLTVMTGGGPGLMEAANRGAKEAGGRSIGCTIRLPRQETPNAYLDRYVRFHYFFVRKVMLVKYSCAFIVLPGSLGTMDELFEALTLIQTRKIHEFPVILMGLEYWQPVLDMLERMVAAGTISRSDLDLLLTTDSVEQAMTYIQAHAIERFGLRLRKAPRPSRVLAQ